MGLALASISPANPARAQAAQQSASSKALLDLRSWLSSPRSERSVLSNAAFARVPLTRADADAATAALWQDHAEFIRETRSAEMAAKVIELGGLKMKFETVLFTNAPPANGHSLFLSLHGGGGAPPSVNESQWRNQIRLAQGYHPSEGIYLAPRAPTDEWNLWHQNHIDTFFGRLIENLIVLSNVNPNRVYVFGYSAGGDGVYQIVPRTADRWAAATMMAGHPNEASPLGLRDVPFAIHVGANDDGFNRNRVAKEWGEKLDKLQREDLKGYIHVTELHEGRGHWMNLEDKKAIPWMEQFTRVPLPEKVVWFQDDATHTQFYWLAVPPDQPKAGQEIVAERAGQTIALTSKDARKVTLLLKDVMMNLEEPVKVRAGDKVLFDGRVDRTIGTLTRTLAARGDTNLMFSAEVTISMP